MYEQTHKSNEEEYALQRSSEKSEKPKNIPARQEMCY